MLTAQRHQLIADELAQRGRVVSGELAQRYGLSEDTIRRDLRQMTAKGLCRRVYGGAVAPDAGPLLQRHDHLAAEKATLAGLAVGLITAGQTVMIDAGSTNSAIAAALPDDLGLTAITNAPDIAASLGARRGIEVVMLGGVLGQGTGACTGPQTLAALSDLRADWLFLGSCGLDPARGVTAHDAHEAAVKRAMVGVCAGVAVAATSDKLGTAAPFRVASCDKIDVMITQHPVTGYGAIRSLTAG